jgi:hypothetical protein
MKINAYNFAQTDMLLSMVFVFPADHLAKLVSMK